MGVLDSFPVPHTSSAVLATLWIKSDRRAEGAAMESDEGAEGVLAADPPAERDRGPRPAAEIQQSVRRGRSLDSWGRFGLVLGSVLLGAVLLVMMPVEILSGTPLSVLVIVVNSVRIPLFWVDETWGAVTGLVLVLFGLWAVSRGRRHLHRVLPDLRSVPAGDQVVLFLRSFSADTGFARTQASRVGRWVMWPPPVTPADVRTEEEQVARGVAPFGRMVALGRPAERLPRSGAERSYVPDEQWQSEVLAGLERANLVLLVAGAGEGLRWEVEQAVRRDDPARLVLAVSRDRGHYEHFRGAVGDVFPKGLPDGPRMRSSRVRYVRAVVWFEEDWTPNLEVLTGRFPLLRPTARTQHALPRALRPVYERAGLEVPTRRSSSRPRPRVVPTGVALFSSSWFGTSALLAACLSYLIPRIDFSDSTSHTSGDATAAVPFFVALVLVFLVLYVVLMLRVLRGGLASVLMMQILCITLGAFLLASGLVLGLFSLSAFSGSGFAVATLLTTLLGLNLLVVGVAAPIIVWALLFRREVREWIDSRT